MIESIMERWRRWDARPIEWDSIHRALMPHRNLFLYFLFISAVAFAFELFQFNLSMDEETLAYQWGANRAWIQQSRWGMYLLGFVIPKPVVPVVPLAITLCFASLALSLALRIVAPEKSTADYLVAPLALVCPTLYFAYHFSILNFGIGIGLFLSSLGVYIYKKKGRLHLPLSIASLCLAIGTYQAMCSYILVLYVFWLVSRSLNEKLSFRSLTADLREFGTVFLSALLSYYLLTKLFMLTLNIKADGYLSSFVNYSLNWRYLTQATQTTLTNVWKFYSGHKDIYISSVNSLKYLMLISSMVVFYRILRSSASWGMKIGAFAGVIFAMLAPFFMNMMNYGEMPIRSSLGFPLACALLTYFAAQYPSRILQMGIYGLAALCYIHFATINNLLSHSELLVGRADRRMIALFQERINTYPKLSNKPVTKIELIGSRNWRQTSLFVRKETVGTSFFGWDGGSAQRVINYMQTMGFHKLKPASLKQRRKLMDIAEAMPIWPHQDSVKVVNGIAILKVGRYTSRQLRNLCRGTPEPHALCYENRILPSARPKVSE